MDQQLPPPTESLYDSNAYGDKPFVGDMRKHSPEQLRGEYSDQGYFRARRICNGTVRRRRNGVLREEHHFERRILNQAGTVLGRWKASGKPVENGRSTRRILKYISGPLADGPETSWTIHEFEDRNASPTSTVLCRVFDNAEERRSRKGRLAHAPTAVSAATSATSADTHATAAVEAGSGPADANGDDESWDLPVELSDKKLSEFLSSLPPLSAGTSHGRECSQALTVGSNHEPVSRTPSRSPWNDPFDTMTGAAAGGPGEDGNISNSVHTWLSASGSLPESSSTLLSQQGLVASVSESPHTATSAQTTFAENPALDWLVQEFDEHWRNLQNGSCGRHQGFEGTPISPGLRSQFREITEASADAMLFEAGLGWG